MKILLDHCVPKRFGRGARFSATQTTAQMDCPHSRTVHYLPKRENRSTSSSPWIKTSRASKTFNPSYFRSSSHALMNTVRALRLMRPSSRLSALTPGQMVEIDATGAVTVIAPGRAQ